MTLSEALQRLKDAKPLLDRYGVARVGVFGSVARGESGPDSDLDVLVEFDPTRVPGWEFFGLGEELAEVMACPVDVATAKALPQRMREAVLREVVYA